MLNYLRTNLCYRFPVRYVGLVMVEKKMKTAKSLLLSIGDFHCPLCYSGLLGTRHFQSLTTSKM